MSNFDCNKCRDIGYYFGPSEIKIRDPKPGRNPRISPVIDCKVLFCCCSEGKRLNPIFKSGEFVEYEVYTNGKSKPE